MLLNNRTHRALMVAIALACVRPAVPLCAQKLTSHTHSHWSDGHRSLDVLIDGDVDVNTDATDIARLPAGSMVSIEETENGRTWRARFTPGINGLIRREYWLNEAPSTISAIGEGRVQHVMVEVIREHAIGAEGRVSRLMASGGASAVLKDIADVHSDGAQRTYYSILSLQALRGEDATKAIDQAMRNMNSDGDRRIVLFAFMLRKDLSNGAQEALLKGAERLHSDGDKSRVLQGFASERPLDDRSIRSAFFSSTESINSDGDKRRVLTTVLRTSGDRKPVVQDVVLSARSINSDGDKSSVLLRVPEALLRDPDIYKQYLETLKTINSSGDRTRVQTYLLRSDLTRGSQGTR